MSSVVNLHTAEMKSAPRSMCVIKSVLCCAVQQLSSIQTVDVCVHVTGYTIQLLCLVTRKIRNFLSPNPCTVCYTC
jgi:hypothetical protein